MSAITDILAQLPIGQLSQQLGVTEKETTTASTQVITSLLGGLTANTQDSTGEASLASALLNHAKAGQAFESNGVDLAQIDTKDGAKIVKHALGETTSKTASALAQKTGTDESLLSKLLPILAPIVLAYVANKAMGSSTQQSSSGSNVVSSLIGGLLGGSSSTSAPSSGLGSLLGSNSGGLSSMLGGFLGQALGSKAETPKAQSSSSSALQGILDAIF